MKMSPNGLFSVWLTAIENGDQHHDWGPRWLRMALYLLIHWQ